MVLHGGSKEVNNFDNPRFTQNIFQKSHVWLPFLGHWIPKIRRDGFPLYSAIVRWFFRFLGFGVKLFSTFIVKFYHRWRPSATSWLCIELHMTEIDGAPFVRKLLRFVCLFGQKMTQIYGSRMASYFLVSLSITCVPKKKAIQTQLSLCRGRSLVKEIGKVLWLKWFVPWLFLECFFMNSFLCSHLQEKHGSLLWEAKGHYFYRSKVQRSPNSSPSLSTPG